MKIIPTGHPYLLQSVNITNLISNSVKVKIHDFGNLTIQKISNHEYTSARSQTDSKNYF